MVSLNLVLALLITVNCVFFVQSAGDGLLQQAPPSATPSPSPWQIKDWSSYEMSIRASEHLDAPGPNICKDELMAEAKVCYDTKAKDWDYGGNQKSYCCFTHDFLDCFVNAASKHCEAKEYEKIASSAKQEELYYSWSNIAPRDMVCGDYHKFWQCRNGLATVIGVACGSLLVIAITVGVVVYILHKRRRSSNIGGRGDNL